MILLSFVVGMLAIPFAIFLEQGATYLALGGGALFVGAAIELTAQRGHHRREAYASGRNPDWVLNPCHSL